MLREKEWVQRVGRNLKMYKVGPSDTRIFEYGNRCIIARKSASHFTVVDYRQEQSQSIMTPGSQETARLCYTS